MNVSTTNDNILEAINNINKQITFIKSIYNIGNSNAEMSLQEKEVINNIQNSVEDIVQSIEPTQLKKEEVPEENSACKFVSTVEDNDTLLISEKQGKIFLPYTVNDLNAYLEEYPDEYKSLSDVVNQEYIVSIDKYKNQSISRFKEMYCLMRDIEMKSIIESFKRAVEIMFNTRVNPAIIAACKSEEQINNYLYCLERNNLENFKDFKIVFEVSPMSTIKNYEFEWEEIARKDVSTKKKGKHHY